MISNNSLFNCIVGIGCGEKADDHLIIGNIFQSCRGALRFEGTASTKQVNNVTIANNGFYDTGRYPIELVNVKGAMIVNNTFKDITEVLANLAYMAFTQSSPLVCSNINIEGNNFIRTNANAYKLLTNAGTISEIFSSKNQFIGVGGNEINDYFVQVSNRGLVADHYKNINSTAGMNISLNTDPTGWVTAGTGDFATDVVAGNVYRYNGTNWVVVVP
jgi:hypothetical protein